jgi:hypothetical protein
MMGACCIANADGTLHCIETDELHCLDEGGDWQGAGTHCENSSCGGPSHGACCINGGCLMLSTDDCDMVHGSWHETSCDQVECPAYCQGDVNGDGIVNVNDILIVLSDWGPCN